MRPFGGWKRLRRKLRRLWRACNEHESIDLEEWKELEETSPTKKYVNWLLLEMTKAGVTELILNSSRPLPPSKLMPDAEIPTFESVTNRLKVMANLDPVIYQQPVEGRLDLTIGSHPVAVHLRFVDTAPDRSVHLRAEWLDPPKQQPTRQ